MSSYMDFIKEQLYTLTSIPSPSGFTRKATDYLLSELSSWVIPLNAPIRKCICHPGWFRFSTGAGSPCGYPGRYGPLH